jgi:hypothetical protein
MPRKDSELDLAFFDRLRLLAASLMLTSMNSVRSIAMNERAFQEPCSTPCSTARRNSRSSCGRAISISLQRHVSFGQNAKYSPPVDVFRFARFFAFSPNSSSRGAPSSSESGPVPAKASPDGARRKCRRPNGETPARTSYAADSAGLRAWQKLRKIAPYVVG